MEYSKSDQKWEFRPGGQTESPQNSAIKDFSKHIFESIVREAIQNSLDNPDTTTNEPVIIKFEFGNIRPKDVLGYNDLIKHYKATKKFWHKDKNYKSIFDSIDNRLQDFKEKLPFLKISDFNTIGMHLESEYGKNQKRPK